MGEWNCDLEDFARAVNGKILSRPHASFSRVGTDSRKDLKGMLFVPLKGDNFNAHDFIPKAIEQGATCALVHEWRAEWEQLKAKCSFVQVDDTLKGFQEFALFWRRKNKFKVLAISGSVGKTSTKEFARALLEPHFKVHSPKGSYNNHWGVPMTILDAGPEITHLIVEMGMNKAGELWRLCQIAEPDIALVTTVGRAHIGELGSQEAVARAKEELYIATPKAIHIFNVDNEWTMRMQTRSQTKQILFSGFKPKVDISLRAQRMNWDGLDVSGQIAGVTGQTWVHILGRHNVVNIMGAAGLALAVGMTPQQIWKGIAAIKESAWGRNQMVPLNNGSRVLFDAYNSSPDSVQALVKNLYEMEVDGRKFLIIGDMKEQGAFASQVHEEAGERAASIAFEAIWYVGEYANDFWRGFQKVKPLGKTFSSAKVDQKIAAEFLGLLKAGDLVAIKASRGIALEHVLDNWPLSSPLGKKP